MCLSLESLDDKVNVVKKIHIDMKESTTNNLKITMNSFE